MDNKSDGKSFFRIMIGETISEKLRLPRKFVKIISVDLSSSATATLVGPSGRSWSVRVSYRNDDVYLKSGWQEFQKDNLVKGEELLVFKYEGGMRFLVKIFGLSGVERIQVNVPTSVEQDDPPVVGRKRGRPRKHPISTPNSDHDGPSG